MFVTHACVVTGDQKRATDSLKVTDGCGCWELKSGPLEEEPMLLTTLAPYNCPFLKMPLCLAFIDELQNNDFLFLVFAFYH